MKKRSLIAVVLTLGILLAGCGSKASSGSDKDYVQILQDARTDEFNESYAILSNGENGFEVTGGNSEEMDDENKQRMGDMILEFMGLETADMEKYALSVSLMNVKSYGIAIIQPAEGSSEKVETALQNFIQTQQAAYEFYLQDQYEIAKDARLTQAADGSWVMVMCEDATAVNDSILNALK
jgi:hypothetical protein